MSATTTAAQSLTTATTLFAGPGRVTNITSSITGNASLNFMLDGSVQTLSSQDTPTSGTITGLLFVPSLDPQDPCNEATAPFIPSNVTRYSDVSPFSLYNVGLAPWVSIDCTHSYLDVSRQYGAQALVFFLPSNTDTKPPPPEDSVWDLHDGDAWKTLNKYPVFAISGWAGATLMQQLSWYSGNIQADSNTALGQDPQEAIRLVTLIEIASDDKRMPSLWGFVLAILGTLLVLSIILLLCYQFVQKRRRDNLRRRIEGGEADVEYLGLHQIKVPQEIIDQIPVYTYPNIGTLSKASWTDSHDQTRLNPPESSDAISIRSGHCEQKEQQEGDQETETQANSSTVKLSESTVIGDTSKPLPNRKRGDSLITSQTTCAICLDDFVPGSSIIRELPCGHIFHVECIDTSLTQNSSLCPLCKKTVLPPGCYLVPVTNMMVHRDHAMRRSRIM